MRRLRAPDGCPWDREQTHESLRKYLLEEAAEAVDALHTGHAEHIAEELGDVLLQVAFHAVIAEEAGTFHYDDIEGAIVDKLIRRHPHVFGEMTVKDAAEVVSNWQTIKAREKGTQDGAAAVPQSLPALLRASELAKKLHWATATKASLQADFDKLAGDSESLGDLLLNLTLFARAQGVDAELALRDACSRRLL
jgi:XTP/dITP diphosphohydrolase